MKNDLTLTADNYGVLRVCADENRDEPDYIMWTAASGYASGVTGNSAKLRQFLRRALKRLEDDANRRKWTSKQ